MTVYGHEDQFLPRGLRPTSQLPETPATTPRTPFFDEPLRPEGIFSLGSRSWIGM